MTGEPGQVQVHWLAGVSLLPWQTVVSVAARLTGDSVEVRPRGALGYATRYQVGPVTVLANGQGPQAEAMGCHVEITGSGSEALGVSGLARIYQELELRASRIDLAVDGCPFTPEQVWASWRAGEVRSKVQIPADARPDRQYRSGRFESSPTGDTAYLGSPRASRMARVYDRRDTGTRFELQARGRVAAVLAMDLLSGEVDGSWSSRVLEHVRAFVDFVEVTDDLNASRRELLPWWSAFCGHVERSRVRFSGMVVESFEAVVDWLDSQVAPLLAVFEARLGRAEMERLLSRGRSRWRQKHGRLAMAVTA